MKTVQSPPWLQEEPALLGLLHLFIDRLDQGPTDEVERRLTLRLTRRHCPELYGSRDESEYLWSLIRSLDKQYQIWTIKGPRAKPGEPEFEKIRLEFNEEAEVCVREWLHRPLIDPYSLIWKAAIDKHARHWPASTRFMQNAPLRCENRSPEDIVQALIRFAGLTAPMTLREASAHSFWGDSKFAESKEAWLREVFPARMADLLPRPILLDVVVPIDVHGVLWIENQDTFLRFAFEPPREAAGLALVYCAGFRATSPRIREPGHAVFCSITTSRSARDASALAAFWRGEQALPCHFWGDLDFAGMGILASLRIAFPNMQAWQPGYCRLAEALQQGVGHSPDLGMDVQADPNVTGCGYADHVLLPLLRQRGLAIDQEYVAWH